MTIAKTLIVGALIGVLITVTGVVIGWHLGIFPYNPELVKEEAANPECVRQAKAAKLFALGRDQGAAEYMVDAQLENTKGSPDQKLWLEMIVSHVYHQESSYSPDQIYSEELEACKEGMTAKAVNP